MSNFVLVIDTDKRPQVPVHPAVARKLLTAKKAAVFRQQPFTIILKESCPNESIDKIELKIDPGSKTTGFALVQRGKVIFGLEVNHRGQSIKNELNTRRAVRRNRRNRHTRYREPRFLNRKRQEGWLAPSLNHRVKTTITWVKRIMRYTPIDLIAQELVKFDLQKLENPEISGVEYQQGELAGYEVREYLLEKFYRKCAYCGKEGSDKRSLEVEHVKPKSKGGSNRISNLVLACHKCNEKKGNQELADFLKGKPDVLKRVMSQLKAPLKDATVVNSTRWALFNELKKINEHVVTSSGGKTKHNRIRLNLPKEHWIDAACVGDVDNLIILTKKPLVATSTGKGTRRLTRINKFGFPCSSPRQKYSHCWETGDIALITKTKGKNIGTFKGRVVVQGENKLEIRIGKLRISGKCSEFKKVWLKDGYKY